jgi:hypothetical protein
MAHLTFATSILTIELGYRLRLQSAAKQTVNSRTSSAEAVNVLALFEEFISADKCNVDGAASEADNI